MAERINVAATDVWNYFQEHKEELKKIMHQTAGNEEYGVEVYITEDSGFPNIVVTADDVQVYETTVENEHECYKEMLSVYDEYLSNKATTTLSCDDETLTRMEIEDLIFERESELDYVVYDFVETVTQGVYGHDNIDDVVSDLKEHFLEYMARKHQIPVYRPMILQYDDGDEAVSEYPYEEMEFDDPDNALYKT